MLPQAPLDTTKPGVHRAGGGNEGGLGGGGQLPEAQELES
jgi:hypothetical protein